MADIKRKTVLVISRYPHLEEIRRHVLEEAGYQVVTARTPEDIEAAAKNEEIDLAIVGYSIPGAVKERLVSELMIICECPILELWDRQPPRRRSEHPIFDHFSLAPDDFLSTVNAIFGRPSSKAKDKPYTPRRRKQ